jgi:spore germination protein YaaH
MSEPLGAPQPAPQPAVPRQRRRWGAWLVGLALVLLMPVIGQVGYLVGRHYSPASLWDPLWVRAYVDRPIDTAAPGPGFWVTGYYVDYDKASLQVVKTSANHMDQVVVFGYGFDRAGNVTGNDQQVVRALTGPQKRVLLFGNLTNDTFDKATAHAILTDRAVQDKVVAAVLTRTAAMDASGVQIDFENIALGDRDAYTAFLKRLKEELAPRKLTLSVAVAAKTRDSRDGWGGATDYTAIGQIVDYVYIMAYDEHWQGGEPGPVASLPWVEAVVRYATGVIPSQKLLLGVPFYGYDWAADAAVGVKTNKAYGSGVMTKRVSEYGASVKWDPVAAENVATFKTADGERIAWYPDERSLDAKLKLAYQYNLKGIALWRFGFEPATWWEPIGTFRVKPGK